MKKLISFIVLFSFILTVLGSNYTFGFPRSVNQNYLRPPNNIINATLVEVPDVPFVDKVKIKESLGIMDIDDLCPHEETILEFKEEFSATGI